jgi:hypothetical protein
MAFSGYSSKMCSFGTLNIKICNSSGRNPKPRVKIAINTKIHMSAKNWLNLRRFRILKAIP